MRYVVCCLLWACVLLSLVCFCCHTLFTLLRRLSENMIPDLSKIKKVLYVCIAYAGLTLLLLISILISLICGG